MTEPFMLDLHMYLGRLGYSSAPPPTLDTLRELQERHTAEFPFETLASMLRVPVEVEPAAIQDKQLRQGRGGYCFELNRLYLLLLQELGFDARGLTGRVVMGGPEDALPARTHMLVLVTLGAFATSPTSASAAWCPPVPCCSTVRPSRPRRMSHLG